jgi:hypothetical protein
MLDILNLEPTKISRDLRGKYICIYGLPKVGKTTLACQFPKNLLLGFEHGWNAIAGAKAIDITKWSDFKMVLRQLEKKEAKEMYDTITIDTVGIAWELAEQYVCAQHGVQKISDVPWGQGYKDLAKEFENSIRKITQLGYGLVIIAHVDKRVEMVAEDNEVEILGPAIPKRAYAIVNQLVDIIGYIAVTWNEKGESERWLYTRKTPTIMAGSRFPHLAEKIKFGYAELTEALNDAIDKAEALDGATVVDKSIPVMDTKLNYDDIRKEASELWTKLVTADENNAKIILKKVEMNFNRKMKLSEITENQVEPFYSVLLEMREMANKLDA